MTIFAIAYNEAIMLPHFVAHYRKNFSDCRIVIYNNMSDDGTKEIALGLGCDVIDYDTGGKLSDQKYLEIKNSCFEGALPDEKGHKWVFIGDIDEHCHITAEQLYKEQEYGTTIIDFIGYNMVALDTTMDITTIKYGVRAPSYDKRYIFDASQIHGINYKPGCHRSDPQGKVVASQGMYECLHYKYININYMIARHAHYASRMSDDNIRKGYGCHYLYPADQIREEFEEARKNAIKIL